MAAGASGALAASGIGIVGSRIANVAIDTTAYIVNSAIEDREINGIELFSTVVFSTMTAGEGINGRKMRGVYKRSKEVLSTAVSASKKAMYNAKIKNVKKTVVKEIGKSIFGEGACGVIKGIKTRIGFNLGW